jgi:hypothetical protein
MTSPTLKHYRVFVHEWIVWDAVVEAASEEDAERAAQDLWDTDGYEAFSVFNNGNDGATVGDTVEGGP